MSKSKHFKITIIDFTKNSYYSKRASQPALIRWMTEVNSGGRLMPVNDRRLVKKRLKRIDIVPEQVYIREEQERVGRINGYSVQCDKDGLIEKLVAHISLRKTKLAALGVTDKCKLLGKTILLSAHSKINEVISIDVWVKKPRIKVNVPKANIPLRTFNNKDV